MGRLQDERTDGFSGMRVSNESDKLPGHYERMNALTREVHEAMGPLVQREREGGYEIKCECTACKNYRATNTKGPEHLSKEGTRKMEETKTEEPKQEEKRRCRVCGCTDDRACVGSCYWVEDDLCSKCN